MGRRATRVGGWVGRPSASQCSVVQTGGGTRERNKALWSAGRGWAPTPQALPGCRALRSQSPHQQVGLARLACGFSNPPSSAWRRCTPHGSLTRIMIGLWRAFSYPQQLGRAVPARHHLLIRARRAVPRLESERSRDGSLITLAKTASAGFLAPRSSPALCCSTGRQAQLPRTS